MWGALFLRLGNGWYPAQERDNAGEERVEPPSACLNHGSSLATLTQECFMKATDHGDNPTGGSAQAIREQEGGFGLVSGRRP
jgi:hypothetical protein